MPKHVHSATAEVNCHHCGHTWTAIYRSGSIKKMALCSNCGKETPTAKKLSVPDGCPECHRPNYQDSKKNWLCCKFCGHEVFGWNLSPRARQN